MSTYWLITDAWGQHRSLIPLFDSFTPIARWQVIDPYGGQPFAFNHVEQAQQYFIHRCGLDGYTELLISLLKQSEQPLTILAIGEGADALWPLLSSVLAEKINKVFLVDSWVIDEDSCAPKCPVSFVQSQPCQPQLLEQLAQWGPVYVSEARRGFFNPRSTNFVSHAANEVQTWLRQQLEQN